MDGASGPTLLMVTAETSFFSALKDIFSGSSLGAANLSLLILPKTSLSFGTMQVSDLGSSGLTDEEALGCLRCPECWQIPGCRGDGRSSGVSPTRHSGALPRVATAWLLPGHVRPSDVAWSE